MPFDAICTAHRIATSLMYSTQTADLHAQLRLRFNENVFWEALHSDRH